MPVDDRKLTGEDIRFLAFGVMYDDRLYPVLSDLVRVALLGGRLQPAVHDYLEGALAPPPDDNEVAAQLAVFCDDVAWPQQLARYVRDKARDGRRYPFYGAAASTVKPCTFWPYRPLEPPTRIGPGNRAPGILMVQADLDTATPDIRRPAPASPAPALAAAHPAGRAEAHRLRRRRQLLRRRHRRRLPCRRPTAPARPDMPAHQRRDVHTRRLPERGITVTLSTVQRLTAELKPSDTPGLPRPSRPVRLWLYLQAVLYAAAAWGALNAALAGTRPIVGADLDAGSSFPWLREFVLGLGIGLAGLGAILGRRGLGHPQHRDLPAAPPALRPVLHRLWHVGAVTRGVMLLVPGLLLVLEAWTYRRGSFGRITEQVRHALQNALGPRPAPRHRRRARRLRARRGRGRRLPPRGHCRRR